MTLDLSQNEKGEIITCLILAFGTVPCNQSAPLETQEKARLDGLGRLQNLANREGGDYEVFLKIILRNLIAENEDDDCHHDWLRNTLTSLANDSSNTQLDQAVRDEAKNKIFDLIEPIPELASGGKEVFMRRMSWT